jgi:hypothetical protein
MMVAVCSQWRQCKEGQDFQGKLLVDNLEEIVTKLGNIKIL